VTSGLKAPFDWYGGKSRVAHLVWQRFGNVPNYCEPFFGSGAVLLARPYPPGNEVINDLNCFVANFWRTLSKDPKALHCWSDWPSNETDLHARHKWLIGNKAFREKMHADPDYFDAKIAGWWVWGQKLWIGGRWCGKTQSFQRQLIRKEEPWNLDDTYQLANRLRKTHVLCGDWTRACTNTLTTNSWPLSGVFLDPPYDVKITKREMRIYSTDDASVSTQVREWAIEHGDSPKMRIALCGHEAEHKMPKNWECINWAASAGPNSRRGHERIWFSPYCLRGRTLLS
jgi:DNA adenine methylase